MRNIAYLILSFVSLNVFGQDSFFDRVDSFFKKNVTNGLVDYSQIAAEPTALNILVQDIADYIVIGKDPQVQKAFYTNAYNILVIKQIIDNYPTTGPMSINGFFDKQNFEVAGQEMTLDELEKEVLFPAFSDPRLHFVLVCAAMGCPPIADYAYHPESLDSLLENKTREVLNINWYVRVSKNKTRISRVFDWYSDNFVNDTTNIKSYINRYREIPIPEAHSLEPYKYDWSLNDAQNTRY